MKEWKASRLLVKYHKETTPLRGKLRNCISLEDFYKRSSEEETERVTGMQKARCALSRHREDRNRETKSEVDAWVGN